MLACVAPSPSLQGWMEVSNLLLIIGAGLAQAQPRKGGGFHWDGDESDEEDAGLLQR